MEESKGPLSAWLPAPGQGFHRIRPATLLQRLATSSHATAPLSTSASQAASVTKYCIPELTMASKKDVRRPDLVIPYQEPIVKSDGPDVSSTMSQTLPMAAIFMRNRYIGWASVVFSIQNWLGESEYNKTNSSTPGYFSVGMALMSLVVTYLPMFLPPPPGSQKMATGTEAAAPVPPA